jgi:hypothetical protein
VAHYSKHRSAPNTAYHARPKACPKDAGTPFRGLWTYENAAAIAAYELVHALVLRELGDPLLDVLPSSSVPVLDDERAMTPAEQHGDFLQALMFGLTVQFVPLSSTFFAPMHPKKANAIQRGACFEENED